MGLAAVQSFLNNDGLEMLDSGRGTQGVRQGRPRARTSYARTHRGSSPSGLAPREPRWDASSPTIHAGVRKTHGDVLPIWVQVPEGYGLVGRISAESAAQTSMQERSCMPRCESSGCPRSEYGEVGR